MKRKIVSILILTTLIGNMFLGNVALAVSEIVENTKKEEVNTIEKEKVTESDEVEEEQIEESQELQEPEKIVEENNIQEEMQVLSPKTLNSKTLISEGRK